MDSFTVGIIGILLFVLVLLSKLPVALAMILIGFIGFSYLVSVQGALNLLSQDIFETFYSYTMSVIPLFLLMGNIAFHAGISRRLFFSAYQWVGHLPGGLAIATIGACAAFAAVCGSLTASVATMCTVALPEMQKYKYDRGLATGTIAAGGTLGVLIPPSVIFILYGIQTEQSIGKLFISGILPGILLAGLFSSTIYILCRRNPHLGPPGPSVNFGEKLSSLQGGMEMIILFILVIGGLFAGLFTPTEGGAIGAIGAILLALIRKQLTWEGFRNSLVETMRITCMIFLLLYGTTIFGQFLAVSKIPTALAQWLISLPVHPVITIAGILLIYLIGGCIMGGLAFMILTVPIFFPVTVALGFDPILFGVLMVLMVEVGSITPPVGTSVYIVSGIAKDVPLEVVFRGILPFLIAFTICILILLAFPQVALFLPSLMR